MFHSALIFYLTYFSFFSFLEDCFSTQSLGGSWFKKFLYRKAEAIAY